MKKSNLFKSMKEVKKSVKDDLLEVGAALAGGILGDIAYTKGKEQLPENYRQYTGAAVGLVGGALSVFSKNTKIKAAAHGIVGSAGTNILNDLAPEMATKIGLSGLAETETVTSSELEKMMKEALDAELRAQKTQTETQETEVTEFPGVDE